MYPLVKLSLVAVSLVGLVTSSLALAGHTLAACSAHYPAYPGCWLGHPTPLLLAELSLMVTMSQVTTLAVTTLIYNECVLLHQVLFCPTSLDIKSKLICKSYAKHLPLISKS